MKISIRSQSTKFAILVIFIQIFVNSCVSSTKIWQAHDGENAMRKREKLVAQEIVTIEDFDKICDCEYPPVVPKLNYDREWRPIRDALDKRLRLFGKSIPNDDEDFSIETDYFGRRTISLVLVNRKMYSSEVLSEIQCFLQGLPSSTPYGVFVFGAYPECPVFYTFCISKDKAYITFMDEDTKKKAPKEWVDLVELLYQKR